uniref:Uncharacterized protein n=1 Tax=Daphnia galeata TaxID=27404 RepID=A0A8J2RXE7_9CRUS|nr:unnamed protein product [Daphnia galeata]
MSVEHIKMDTEISTDEVVGEGWKGKFRKLLLISNFLLGICTISLSYLKLQLSVFPLISISCTYVNLDWMVFSAGLYLMFFAVLLYSNKLNSNANYFFANFALFLGCCLIYNIQQNIPQPNMMPCKILDAMSSKLPANISKLELGTVCDWEKLFTEKFHIDAALNSKNVFANLSISSPEFGTIFEATKSFLHEGILVTVDAIPCCHLKFE